MSRSPATFKQSDVTRVFKGAAAAGVALDQIEVEIMPGRIVVRPVMRQATAEKENPWDEVLK